MCDTSVTRRGLLTATALSASQVPGANDRLRAGFIGCGNRGSQALLPAAIELGAEAVALCDVFRPQLDRAAAVLREAGRPAAEFFSEYRKLIERKDIDVVFIATPDHWHAPMTVAACQAGKDVYVEKPLANSVEDCLAIVDVTKKTQRVVQVGLQQRSMKIYYDALGMLRDGVIGRVERCSMVWGYSGSGGRAEVAAKPGDLDWEAFQGPAPRRPYTPARHRNWRSFWEYGSGALTDFGVHLLDVARWFMNAGDPVSCYGVGLHSPRRSPEMVPDIAELVWKFDSFPAVYSSRREGMLNTFHGERGELMVNRGMLRTLLRDAPGKPPQVSEQRIVDPGFEKSRADRYNIGNIVHVRNFFECVRSRKQPNSDVESAFHSTVSCLLAARAVRTGKPYRWDDATRAAV